MIYTLYSLCLSRLPSYLSSVIPSLQLDRKPVVVFDMTDILKISLKYKLKSRLGDEGSLFSGLNGPKAHQLPARPSKIGAQCQFC